jgi:hypothetical protein
MGKLIGLDEGVNGVINGANFCPKLTPKVPNTWGNCIGANV